MQSGRLPGEDTEERVDILAEALALAREGFAVFPLKGKRPTLDGGFKNATTEEGEVRTLWAKGRGDGIGLRTSAEVWVLDVDTKGAANGWDTLARLEAEYGALPDTLRADTPSGGAHLYFAGGGSRNKASFLPGLDTRAEGGYVVAPPSPHPEAPGRYRWVNWGTPIAAPPAWLLEVIERGAPSSSRDRSAPPSGDRPSSFAGDRLAGDERVREWVARLLQGEGVHDSATRLAASFVEAGVPGERVRGLLEGLAPAVARVRGEARAAEYLLELPRMIEGAELKYAPASVDAEASPYLSAQGRREVAALAGQVDPERLDQWLELASMMGHRIAVRLLEGGQAGIQSLETVRRLGEARLQEAEDVLPDPVADWASEARASLIEVRNGAWLPGGVVGVIAGGGGTGKSTWALQLAGAVADRWPAPSVSEWGRVSVVEKGHGNAWVLLAEEDAEGVRSVVRRATAEVREGQSRFPSERLRVIPGAGRSLTLAHPAEIEDPARGRVTRWAPSPLFDQLLADVRKHAPRLLIVDPLYRLLPQVGGAENDAGAVSAVMLLLAQLRDAAEEALREREGEGFRVRPVLLLVHHARKGGGSGSEGVRGSSAIVDAARWVMMMEREEDSEECVQRYVTKSNYTAIDPRPKGLSRRKDPGGGGGFRTTVERGG
jgi:hypothetical protein